jgi:hypothetical protein
MRARRKLYVANVRCRGAEAPGHGAVVVYVVLASSPGDALRAIRKEYGYDCTVEFDNYHTLKEKEATERLGLENGRAKPLI